ncbi:nucleotidyltransferase domain-containing protein [Bradyrhizobium sp. B120]|uniref:nucleotidyltransferase domain-containing protein n=1 Tax=Bradyrhizobium sp. B120 TaxID=3410088 RepID=UPI003B985E95
MENPPKTFGLSDALFSKVQQRVLALLFGQPERSFYTSEILREVNSGVGAVDRELGRLHHSGLVTLERIGNQKHYRANQDAPIFEELRGLLEKTVNVTEPLKKSFERHVRGIHSAFIFGSVAKGSDTADSDVDILVIGDDLNYVDLYTAAQEAERALQRPVHPLFLSSQDWERHTADHGSVINKISQSPKLFFIGSENGLRHG